MKCENCGSSKGFLVSMKTEVGVMGSIKESNAWIWQKLGYLCEQCLVKLIQSDQMMVFKKGRLAVKFGWRSE